MQWRSQSQCIDYAELKLIPLCLGMGKHNDELKLMIRKNDYVIFAAVCTPGVYKSAILRLGAVQNILFCKSEAEALL